MFEVFFERVTENNSVVDKTFRIKFVNFQYSIHQFLGVCGRIDVTHGGDIDNFLTSMCDNCEFPTVSDSDIALIIGLDKIEEGDPVFPVQQVDDVVLSRKWVCVGDNFAVQSSKVDDWAAFAFRPYDKYWPSDGIGALSGTHASIFACSIKDLVDDSFISSGYTVSTFALEGDTRFERDLQPIFFRLRDSADTVFPDGRKFRKYFFESFDLSRGNIVFCIDVDSRCTEL